MGDPATATFSAPQPSSLPKPAVDQLAAEVARKAGYRFDGELSSVLAAMGGRIEQRHPFDFQVDSGSLEVRAEQDFTIYLPSDTSVERGRFTIAHELGHYVLHYLWHRRSDPTAVSTMRATRYGSDRAEWEANWFAAGFLMPAEAFRAAYAELAGDLARLGERFGVSLHAASIRAKGLGLVKG